MKKILLVIALLFVGFIGISQPNFDNREYHTKTGLIIYEESFGYNLKQLSFLAETVGLGLFENKLINNQSLVIIVNDNENSIKFSVFDISKVIGNDRTIKTIIPNYKNVSAMIIYDNGETSKFTSLVKYDEYGLKLEWSLTDEKMGGYSRKSYITLKEN